MCVCVRGAESLEFGFWAPLDQMVDQGIKTPETGVCVSHRWMGLWDCLLRFGQGSSPFLSSPNAAKLNRRTKLSLYHFILTQDSSQTCHCTSLPNPCQCLNAQPHTFISSD